MYNVVYRLVGRYPIVKCVSTKIAQAPVIGGWAVPGPIFQEENMSSKNKISFL